MTILQDLSSGSDYAIEVSNNQQPEQEMVKKAAVRLASCKQTAVWSVMLALADGISHPILILEG